MATVRTRPSPAVLSTHLNSTNAITSISTEAEKYKRVITSDREGLS